MPKFLAFATNSSAPWWPNTKTVMLEEVTYIWFIKPSHFLSHFDDIIEISMISSKWTISLAGNFILTLVNVAMLNLNEAPSSD